MSGRCKERVWNGQFSDYPCSRKDWKDGYCKQHHPDSVKKRRDDAYARYKAKMSAVADTMYQAKVAEEAALQDKQRRQSEENVQLRLEYERLREAMRSAMAMLDKHEPEPAGAFAVLLLALNPELQSAKNAALRREDKP